MRSKMGKDLGGLHFGIWMLLRLHNCEPREGGSMFLTGSSPRSMGSQCGQRIACVEANMNRRLDNYTFLTRRKASEGTNVYEGQRAQILTGFSNNPQNTRGRSEH